MTRKEFLFISIATFITVCTWVAFDILHKRSQSTVPPEVQSVLEPIDPNFSLESLNLNE